ncbi:hypothetical protein DY000_02004180 [Brassica cretica]|uniref:Uncharacterized protein n=1 Tax=Brassica cretica TaxID=69181 RepID=A0ABQ7C1A7_BRACR|nr:hypothetical protein DY000_02004180 [Brassica cretica]
MIQNIAEAAKDNGFTFSYMTRSSLSLVDELAKKARCNNQNYKLKRSSAENFRRPKTLAVELSLSPVSSLSSLSSLPPPRRCRVVVVVVVAADWWWWSDLAALLFPCSKSVQISFPLPLVSRSGSRSRLRLIDHVYR